MATISVMQALMPYIAIAISVVAIYFGRRDKNQEDLKASLHELHTDLSKQIEKLDSRTNALRVQMAKHVTGYENGIE